VGTWQLSGGAVGLEKLAAQSIPLDTALRNGLPTVVRSLAPPPPARTSL
jgi:hypothetical protein